MKTIFLTGATGGLGEAIAASFLKNEYVLNKVTRQDADLSLFSDIDQLVKRITADTPIIDWVICAHGYIDTETTLEKQSPEAIQKTFAVNTLSIIYLAQQLLPHIPEGGGIIALSSSAGLQANGRLSAYSASKAAVNSFMQAMARNRPEKKFFAVCPGPTNTPMRERVAGDAAQMQKPAVVAEVVHELVDGGTKYKSGDLILVKDNIVSVANQI